MSRRTKQLPGPWVAHRLEMRLSAAWKVVPAPLRRILDRLEEEHMRHGGACNGKLFVNYIQFVAAGVSRRNIAAVLCLGEALGLIEIVRGSEVRGDIREPNQYRLTYLHKGQAAPTDEWKGVTPERAITAVARYRVADKPGSKATDRGRRAAA